MVLHWSLESLVFLAMIYSITLSLLGLELNAFNVQILFSKNPELTLELSLEQLKTLSLLQG